MTYSVRNRHTPHPNSLQGKPSTSTYVAKNRQCHRQTDGKRTTNDMLCLLLVQRGKKRRRRELELSCGVGFSCVGLFIWLCVCVCECGQVYDQQLSLTCSIRGQLSTRGWGNRICRRSYMGDQGVILLWQTSHPSTAVPILPYPGIVVCLARLTGCPLSQRISCCGLYCPFSHVQ